MKTTEPISTRDCTQAFAQPESLNFIDLVHPHTGLSMIYGETLEQIRARYPGAEIVEINHWLARKAAVQDSPVTWAESNETEYMEMLEVLPPAFWEKGLFLVGEPWDHHAISGKPRFAAYRQKQRQYLKASRPMTVGECRSLLHAESAANP